MTQETKKQTDKDSKSDKQVIKIPVRATKPQFSDPLQYKIDVDEEQNFTKQRAYKFLELDVFEGERSVRENHVQFLYDEWAGGRFLWHTVHIASAIVADQGGKEFRINGQHTSWMRVNIPDKVEPLQCDIRRIVYKVATSEQLRALYGAFDRCAPRTVGHISKVLLLDTEAAKEIPTSHLGRLTSGFRLFWQPSTGWRINVMTAAEWTSLINKNYAQLFNTVGRFFQVHYDDALFIRRAPVIGAMFSTFERSIEASQEFWTPVFTAIALPKKSDPRWQLRKWLDEHGLVSGGGGVHQMETISTCIQAWNHWRAGKDITRLVTISEKPKAK